MSKKESQCEYPDAPPTLTDLSQKVLDLYDTLKELEGELLVPYLQTMEQPSDDLTPTSPIEPPNLENLPLQQQPKKRPRRISQSLESSSAWSMSLTSTGLSIQATVRNIAEFYKFAQDLSRQLCRDFGLGYLPPDWELDDEDSAEEEDELDEDEYLVTIPICSTASLLVTNHRNDNVDGGSDSLPSLGDLLQYIHSTKHEPSSVQVSFLMDQLGTFLPPSLDDDDDPLQRIYIYTAYGTLCLLTADKEHTPSELWQPCIEHATDLLFETMITDTGQEYPLVLCAVLVGWIYTHMAVGSAKVETLICLAGRLCDVAEDDDYDDGRPWQALVGCLVQLDIYSAAFSHRQILLCGDGATALWRTVARQRVSQDDQTLIVLEAQVVSLLNQALSLLYTTSDEMRVGKVDVDDILTLIRDIELWEHALPSWAGWTTDQEQQPGPTKHMHMIHNIAKILLFRPLCKDPKQGSAEEDEQTHTRTMFLDLSVASTDRLASCLMGNDHWTSTASHLARDVLARVHKLFDNDEETVNELKRIQQKLEATEQKVCCKIKTI
ncbi:hypothetical protein DFQ29_007432 [Apophysomyces sp. BC1021]|nr:hypothetical protein DFQ29_007432 [Apophysomyces sp. BC1021]